MDNRFKYQAEITIDSAKVFQPVGEMVDAVNKTMHEFGFPEKLVLRTRIGIITAESMFPLSETQLEEHRAKCEPVLVRDFEKQFPGSKAELGPFKQVP